MADVTTPTTTIPTTTLADGTVIPVLGFGTYKLNGFEGAKAIAGAIDVGYRLLDSAFNYENEGTLGAAVKKSSVDRDDLLLTSKLPGRHHSHDEAVATVEESLYRAGLDYWDLYLIHWPNPSVGKYVEAYEALVECRDRGLIKSVGVCNFLPEHLEAVHDATGEYPVINQIELHPYFPQAEQRVWDADHGIKTEGWSPVGRGNDLKSNPTIEKIAKAHDKSVIQTILRWHYQLGVIPLPKAGSPAHQADNAAIFDFELSDAEVAAITSLGRPDGRTNDQDPAKYEEF